MKSINQALVKFQSQLRPVSKDSENPFFKSSYADLSSILQAVMPILSGNGLAVSQPMRVDGDKTILITKLIHESGEELVSEMILPHNSDPQKYGSLITYYKRYQLQAILGVSTKDEDDDGNSVSMPKNVNYESKKQDQPKPTFQVDGIGQQRPLQGAASDAQKNALRKMGIKFNDDITKDEASRLIGEAKRN
jgi:hypothetical protein